MRCSAYRFVFFGGLIIECTDDASTSLDRKFSIFDLTGDGAFRLHVEQVFNANLAIDGTVNLGYVRLDNPCMLAS